MPAFITSVAWTYERWGGARCGLSGAGMVNSGSHDTRFSPDQFMLKKRYAADLR
jgi:hypothetical protein